MGVSKNMGIYWGYIGMMGKKMEATTFHNRIYMGVGIVGNVGIHYIGVM